MTADTLDTPLARLLAAVVVRRMKAAGAGPAIVGICGAQGSGKSTVAAGLVASLADAGYNAATLSLDDLYLTRAEREALARDIHPLLRTRGVPGTHDVALGLSILGDLRAGRNVRLPRFDKARDDRAPVSAWTLVEQPLDVLLFEGWCVGAKPEPDARLAEPINPLERLEDREGCWRRYVNDALKEPYQHLFGSLDLLILLAAPAWNVVLDWRTQQEQALRASVGPEQDGVMDDAALARFVQHYERLTRHILEEMPWRADLTVALRPDRSIRHVQGDLSESERLIG